MNQERCLGVKNLNLAPKSCTLGISLALPKSQLSQAAAYLPLLNPDLFTWSRKSLTPETPFTASVPRRLLLPFEDDSLSGEPKKVSLALSLPGHLILFPLLLNLRRLLHKKNNGLGPGWCGSVD